MATKKASVKKPAAKKVAALKAKKPKVKQQSKADLQAEKAKLFDEIRKVEAEKRNLQFERDQLTRQRKAVNEAIGHCENKISGLGGALDEKHPLFDQPAAATESAKKSDVVAQAARGTIDTWPDLPVERAGITGADAGRLLSAGITTLGKLKEALESDVPIAGVDCNLATQLANQLNTFLKQRQTACPSVPDDSWRLHSLAAAGLTEKQIDALEGADIRTLGALQDAMRQHGEWWAKNLKVHGRLRQGIEDVFTAYVTKVANGDPA
jgi:hypothetical protein